jgi:hypothetical protein
LFFDHERNGPQFSAEAFHQLGCVLHEERNIEYKVRVYRTRFREQRAHRTRSVLLYALHRLTLNYQSVLQKARAAVGSGAGWDSGVVPRVTNSSASSPAPSDGDGSHKSTVMTHISSVIFTTISPSISDSDMIEACWTRWEQEDNEYLRNMITRAMNCDWRTRDDDEGYMRRLLQDASAAEIYGMKGEWRFECEKGLVCGVGSSPPMHR